MNAPVAMPPRGSVRQRLGIDDSSGGGAGASEPASSSRDPLPSASDGRRRGVRRRLDVDNVVPAPIGLEASSTDGPPFSEVPRRVGVRRRLDVDAASAPTLRFSGPLIRTAKRNFASGKLSAKLTE